MIHAHYCTEGEPCPTTSGTPLKPRNLQIQNQSHQRRFAQSCAPFYDSRSTHAILPWERPTLLTKKEDSSCSINWSHLARHNMKNWTSRILIHGISWYEALAISLDDLQRVCSEAKRSACVYSCMGATHGALIEATVTQVMRVTRFILPTL